MWTLTVPSVMFSRLAIILFEAPWTKHSRISLSRSERFWAPRAGAEASGLALALLLVHIESSWLGNTFSPSSTRSEEHTSELQSLMRNSYAVFCLKKKKTIQQQTNIQNTQNKYHS